MSAVPVWRSNQSAKEQEPNLWERFHRFSCWSLHICAPLNARAETAQEKPMFKRCVAEKRCVIPTTGFYEWDAGKKKYLFRLPQVPELYLAGLFNDFKGEKRFTILTMQANSSISDVHHRMPLVLQKKDVNSWTLDANHAIQLLHKIPPMLEKLPVS